MSLTKQKQIALLKLGAITFAVLLAFWFFLIRSAQKQVSQKEKAASELAQKLETKRKVVQRAGQISSQIQVSGRQLQAIEEQMVTGDIYLWIEKILRDFEIRDQVDFIRYDPPQIVESELPFKLPYKTAHFAVNGTATYHDLGTFLANFENSYPHIRIRRLDVEPASLGATKNEKLNFVMEMQALVNPNRASSRKSGS